MLPRLRGAGTPEPAARTAATEPPGSQLTAGDMLRGVASASPDGKLRGFRIFPQNNVQQFSALGLHPGDLVVGVNGASLVDQDKNAGQEIFDSMKTSSLANLTVVDRAGTRRDITLNAALPAPAEETDPTDQ
jgi:hypothetical protein